MLDFDRVSLNVFFIINFSHMPFRDTFICAGCLVIFYIYWCGRNVLNPQRPRTNHCAAGVVNLKTCFTGSALCIPGHNVTKGPLIISWEMYFETSIHFRRSWIINPQFRLSGHAPDLGTLKCQVAHVASGHVLWIYISLAVNVPLRDISTCTIVQAWVPLVLV